MRAKPPAPFDLGGALWTVGHPASAADWVQLVGIAAFALIGGLFTAAVAVARRGSATGDLAPSQSS